MSVSRISQHKSSPYSPPDLVTSWRRGSVSLFVASLVHVRSQSFVIFAVAQASVLK